jgi:acyl-coenzyme A thioesterase PaaI-like protein
MTGIVGMLDAARKTGDWQPLADAIPYASWLGISADRSTGELLGKLSYSDKLVGNPLLPALHGGTVAALLESTAIFQVMMEAETLILPKTINFTVAYLRSAKPVDTFAKGLITKHGRRVVAVYVQAWQDDRSRPVASAHVHLLVKPSED